MCLPINVGPELNLNESTEFAGLCHNHKLARVLREPQEVLKYGLVVNQVPVELPKREKRKAN